MSLEKLVRMIPPPPVPLEVDRSQLDLDWLDTGLPADYLALCACYGSGTFYRGGDGAYPDIIHNPFAPAYRVVLERELCRLRRRRANKEGFDPFPYPVFPEPNGVLPCGQLEWIFSLYYVTGDHPDRWPMLCEDTLAAGETDGFRSEPCSLTAFLSDMYTAYEAGDGDVRFEPGCLAR